MASRKLFIALLLFAICGELYRATPALAAEKIPETSQAPVRFAGSDGRPAYPADADTNTLSVRCKTADGSTFESCAGAGGGGGAGTEYTEDAVPPANPIGRAISCRRRDALAAETDNDGDWVTGNCTNKGELYVKHPDPISASQSGAWNINNVSGSVSLPTGAATEATLAGIKTGTDKIPNSPATDRTTAAGPFATRLSDGSGFYKATTPSDTQPISAATLPLPSGAATAANQSTGNASLASIDGKITAVNTGAVTISSALPGGSNTIGNVGGLPVTSGGITFCRTVAAASTNATNCKASAGQVYGVWVSNVNAAARYVHLYNNSGTPTCNASIVATFIVPGNTAGAGTNIPIDIGAAFGTGVAICFTSAIDGTGNVSANDGVVMVGYK